MDTKYMKMAIDEAKSGTEYDEVPIGAIIVKDGEVIASAHNEKEQHKCSIYHAEIVAIMRATERLGNWHLDGCDMYVTLEPCAMCAGAIINSRIANVYFGAYDSKAGCLGTLYNLPEDTRFNHRAHVEGGILEEECAMLLSDYFRAKRIAKKNAKDTKI